MIRRSSQSGFSLLELIVVVVLLGILAVGGSVLIINPIESYDAQQRRQQLVDQGEMALRQIAADVRRALPNSLRLRTVGTGWALEMVSTVDGARYRDENEDGIMAAGPDQVLEFGTGDTHFNLLGTFSSLGAFAADHRIVIYNTSPLTLYQHAVTGSNPGIITPAGAVLTLTAPGAPYANEHHININNGATDFQFAQQSPGQRLFVVEDPISYICNPGDSGRLRRHDSYGFNLVQPTAPGGNSVTVMVQLLGCNMTYTAGTSQRGGILSIEITVGDGRGENVNLLHQVHVENLP
jgi:MSHA biogenesis protein MshO